MDSAYANALKRKEELTNELRDVETFLSLYRRFQGPHRQENNPDSLPSPDDAFVSDGFGRNVRALRPPEIADLAERVIRGAGEPLTRAQIVERIENAGHVLNSDDKPRYVGTILWRQKERFTNIPGQGYITADMAKHNQNVADLIAMVEGQKDDAGDDQTPRPEKSD
jgi:hypothetical protein